MGRSERRALGLSDYAPRVRRVEKERWEGAYTGIIRLHPDPVGPERRLATPLKFRLSLATHAKSAATRRAEQGC